MGELASSVHSAWRVTLNVCTVFQFCQVQRFLNGLAVFIIPASPTSLSGTFVCLVWYNLLVGWVCFFKTELFCVTVLAVLELAL